MTRTIISSILNALDDDEVSPFYAVELFFDTDTIRAGVYEEFMSFTI